MSRHVYPEENRNNSLSEYSVGMEMFQITLPLSVLRMKAQSRVILDEECGNDSTSKIPVFVYPRNNYETLQCAGPCTVHWGASRWGGGAVSRRQFTHSLHSSVKACGCLFSSPGMWVWLEATRQRCDGCSGTWGAEVLGSL